MRGLVTDRGRTVLFLAFSAAIAFALRVIIPYQAVLGGDLVAFSETDAWYHMRLVDALVRDFPNRIWFDPYLRHPGGDVVHVGPFFDWLIASVALLLGAGAPSPRLVDMVGAFMPAVIGALTVVPVYVIGRELFSRQAGLWSAAIVGLLPGEILKRSLLGFTDHHCLEVLLSAVVVMFLVLALDAGASRRRRLGCAVLGGVSLGSYLLTWSGGAMFVAFLVAGSALAMLMERYRGRTGGEVAWTFLPCLAIAGIMILPWASITAQNTLQLVAIGGGVVIVLLLHGLARATRGLERGRLVYVGGLAGAAALAGGAIWMSRDLTTSAQALVARLSPARTAALAGEAQPLFSAMAGQPLPLWNQFTTAMFLAAFALGAVIWNARREPRPGTVLFLVWTGGMMLATVGQVRFTYYLAVNVALGAGYACALIGEAVGRWRPGRESMLATVGLVVLLMAPNVGYYESRAKAPAEPAGVWLDALQWLRGNTPEPFGNPDVYYAAFTPASFDSQTPPPEAAYGVLSWWPYGYWIMRVGRRVPVANPMQTGAHETARFLLSEVESEAAALADELGARYAVVNWELEPLVGDDGRVFDGMLMRMARLVGTDPARFTHVAYRTTAAGRQPVMLYTPAYYRTMMSRLHLSEHVPAAVGAATWVVGLEARTSNGSREWDIVSETPFPSYEEAEAFVAAARSSNLLVVGLDPHVSCVPLAPQQSFVRVYRSLGSELYQGQLGPPAIQIFERVAR